MYEWKQVSAKVMAIMMGVEATQTTPKMHNQAIFPEAFLSALSVGRVIRFVL